MLKLEEEDDTGEIGVVKEEQEETDEEMEKRQEPKVNKVGAEEAMTNVKRRRRRRSSGKKDQNPQRNRACVDCIKRCFRMHCNTSSSIPTPPSFFKIMIGFFSESMDIPPAFARAISELLDSNVYLEDAYGLRWRVRVCLLGGLLSFGQGWRNFVLDHAIGAGEFLVFRQIARSVFTVQIFGPSASERLYLCDRSKRQSKKRKRRANADPPGHQIIEIGRNNLDTCRKKPCNAVKRRLTFQNAPDSSNRNMALGSCSTTDPQNHLVSSNASIHLVVDLKRTEDASGLQCSEMLLQAPDVGAVRSQEAADVPSADIDKVQARSKTSEAVFVDDRSGKEAVCNDVVREETTTGTIGSNLSENMLGIGPSANKEVTRNSETCQGASHSRISDTAMVDKETLRSLRDKLTEIYTAAGLIDDHIETENREGSNLPTITNAGANESLAVMDLNEVSMDDIFLSADMYELINDGSELCNPEAFSGELNNCVKTELQNLDSSMDIAHRFITPGRISCTRNKEMSPDASRLSADGVNDTAHGIDINSFPDNELATIREDSSYPETSAGISFSALLLEDYHTNKGNFSFSSENSQFVQNAGIVPINASWGEDSLQLVPGDSAREIVAEIPKPLEDPDIRKKSQDHGNSSEGFQAECIEHSDVFAVNHRKFSIPLPAADETWLEFPIRLPILPRTKKQGRKIVILKDPLMRSWPILYQCSPRFNGFISGWEDITRENNLQEGDTCEFELYENSELVLQVRALNPK